MRPNVREDHHEFLEIYHLTPSEFEKNGNAWPIRIGANTAKPNYHIGPRTTPCYYLVFVLEGEGTFHLNGQTFPLGKHDVFGLFPQATHEYYTNPEKPLRKIFIAFDGKEALQLLGRLGLSPQTPHLSGALTEDCLLAMWDLFICVSDADQPASDLLRLSRFYQVFEAVADIAKGTSMAETGRSVPWLQEGLEYLQIHYAEGITVERVAEHVGVERTHFTKQFRKAYGMPPMQYMQYLKLNEAKRLLEQSSLKLAEVAHTVGYPDLFSFSKAFKKQTGVPPKLYRQHYRARG